MLNSEKPPKIITKPLPKILDKMEANIRAAAEAARRTEEAARRAEEAARRAEEAAMKAETVDISDRGAKKYLVIIEKANDNYSAYSPDVPGCIATGRTLSEVKKTIREAIKFHIEGLQEDGMPLPESISFTEYIGI
jgi:predicted RNase H-like HicB family nuclease